MSVLHSLPIYLDCAATTPIEAAVLDEMIRVWRSEPGNAGSRTHEYGTRAKQLVNKARKQIANVVEASSDEVVFTSGATESNNIAILGLADYAERVGKRHIVSTAIEHKAVLEPLSILAKRGFEVTLVYPDISGAIEADAIASVIRADTVLVSVMHVNNETGIQQPIAKIAHILQNHDSWFHVDAAQGYGKELDTLKNPRIDLISVSSHKIFGPSGIGALVTRRRDFARPPLRPIMYGGGQEMGLRHGTLPVALVAGMGLAARLAENEHFNRRERCLTIRHELNEALETQFGTRLNYVGDQARAIPNILSFSVMGIDTEASIVVLKDMVAISNGSACTSQSYERSHVLEAMALPKSIVTGAVRFSWSHLTPNVDWTAVAKRLAQLA